MSAEELPTINKALVNLKQKEELNIHDPRVQEDLDLIKRHLLWTKSKENFNLLNQMITNIFGNDFPKGSLENISINIYMTGCNYTQNKGLGNCNPICIESLQNPELPSCDETVILAVPKNGRYIFVTKNLIGDRAKIYVPQYRGLKDEEKKELEDLGIKKVQFYDYQMMPLNKEEDLSQIIERKVEAPKSDLNFLMILLVGIIIIFASIVIATWKKK